MAFEELIQEQAAIQAVYTPNWDPDFDLRAFRRMLRELGYAPVKGTRFWEKSCRK